MTSQDSLIESARPISEAEARIERALREAHAGLKCAEHVAANGFDGMAYGYCKRALRNIADILDGGRT